MNVQVLKGGDIFKAPLDTITVTTNTVGVMGKGIALQAKQQIPGLYEYYQWLCSQGLHQVGRPDLWVSEDHTRKVLLFPTKQHWRDPSQIEWIEEGLRYLRAESTNFPFNQIQQLGLVPLGCGEGGLDYRVVKPLILKYLDGWNIPTYLFE